eukprot:scaffold58700_cov53-Attheya_sp.AAC.1
MIARASIETDIPGTFIASFIKDRRKVWDLMAGFLHDKECWTYVKPHQRARDGRGGFLEIWNHYLGLNNAENMATRAERTLDSTTYVGEKRQWNFEKFVRLLNQGIKTKELDVPKSQIMASATLCQDFNACVSLYKDFIELNAPTNPTFNISETNTFVKKKSNNNKYPPHRNEHKRGRNDDDGEDEDIEDRYYDSKEYSELTNGQTRSLKKKQDGRGGGPNSKWARKGGHDRKIASMNSKMEEMGRNISKLIASRLKMQMMKCQNPRQRLKRRNAIELILP